MKTLQELIGWMAMTGIIQSPKGGVPANILPPEFTRVSRRIQGHTFKWRIVRGTRRVARIVHRGAPSTRFTAGTVGERTASVLHSYEHHVHDAEILDALQSMDNPQIQDFGQQEVDRQTAEFRQRFNNLRLMVIYSMLAQGKVWFDANGNLLPTSSGAALTVDAEPATEVTGNVTGTSGVLLGGSAKKWSAADTPIPEHIRQLKTLSAKLSGYTPEYALWGDKLITYLLANNYIDKMLANNGTLASQLETGMIPDGFLGIRKWIPMSGVFFEDASGTVQSIFDDNTLILTPPPSSEWWEVVEGTFPIPTNLGRVTDDMLSARSNFRQVAGMFNYATVTDDPPGLKQYAGDNFLALQKVTKAVLRCIVHW